MGLLIVLPVGWCSLPLKQVATLMLTVVDQNGRPITADVAAIYLDADNREIVKITPQSRGSWGNAMIWWAHSTNTQSLLRPADAKRARTARVEKTGCAPASVPVALERIYEPLSFSPHGGGPAHLRYHFEKQVTLQCQ